MLARTIVIAAALVTAATLQAQQPATGGPPAAHRGALLAITDATPFGAARALVVRRGNPDAQDVIVLPATTATADNLAAAISWLLSSRSRDGDAFANIMRVTITDARSEQELDPGLRRFLEGAIERARRGPAQNVPTVGATHAEHLSLERFRRLDSRGERAEQ